MFGNHFFRILLCIILAIPVYGSPRDSTSFKLFVGLHNRPFDPLNISIGAIFKYGNFPGLCFETGKGKRDLPIGSANILEYTNSNNLGFSNNSLQLNNGMQSTFQFIKFGLVCVDENNKTFNFFWTINYCHSWSNDNLTISISDAMGGKKVISHNEINQYSSIETAYIAYIKVFRNLYAHLETSAGFKALNSVPFEKNYPKIDRRNSYSPGQGYGFPFYINCKVGIAIKL